LQAILDDTQHYYTAASVVDATVIWLIYCSLHLRHELVSGAGDRDAVVIACVAGSACCPDTGACGQNRSFGNARRLLL
jgi:hypothetical protein